MIQVSWGGPGFNFKLLLCQLTGGHFWILVLKHLLLEKRLRRICVLEHLVHFVPQVRDLGQFPLLLVKDNFFISLGF
jgi:hypothetical protein